ncbi:hypothetical protein ONZ51_g7772 [Trametes cubensis]|uniref:Nephrocystin 3-like N-terminal domain-containing protein n=1 Tax=Trametes cubensis TaxID=1111947 RepID=A0AAD7XBE4_9APHY|nr:hypothetical protein ONZ51_g7772 [Trametes cubensis]
MDSVELIGGDPIGDFDGFDESGGYEVRNERRRKRVDKGCLSSLRTRVSSAPSDAPFPTRVAVVIDALDECTDNAAVSIILKSLALYIGKLVPLKFLITSRPEENIARGFLLQSLDENTHKLALNKIPEDLTKRDITVFLQSRLAAIGENFDLGASWPAPQRLENLVGLSELLFIFAALAARYIEDQAEMDPEGRLTSLLNTGNAVAAKRGSTASPFPILDALYIQVLDAAARKLGPIPKSQLKLVLGTIVLAEQRLSPTTLDVLLGLSSGTVRRVLLVLSAILIIPDRKDDTTPIGIIHLSFPNFLVDPTRCTDQSFLVRPRIQHSHIASRCLATMKTLKYNILGLEIVSEHDRVLNSEITDLPARLSRNIPAALEYACRYWTRHLFEAEVCEDLLTALEEFCKCHILHWLEALSLLGCVDGAVEDLQLVQTFLKASIFQRFYCWQICDTYSTVNPQTQSLRATDVPSLLYDCERAIRAFYPVISSSAMHMYPTIALFSPLETPIRRLAAANAPPSLVVRVGLENTWSDTLVSRVIDRRFISALAFSPDGIYVACAKDNGTIQLLNAHTGAVLQIFESHSDEDIEAISFSPTGKELLSGSDDRTVNLWDVATGANLNTWKAHSDWVRSVAWSLDGTLAASGSDDDTVRVWRTASPEKMVVLQHGDWVRNVVFAQDGDLLSGSRDKTCKVWDTRSIEWDTETAIEPIRTLEHDSEVFRVAVSSDSRLVACGLYNGDIVLWTKSDGQRVRSLTGQGEVISLAFYPNGLLAAAYEDSPITLWDASTGARVKSAGNVGARAAAFASDGVHIAHATKDQSHIHLWPSELKQNTTRTTSIAGKLEQLAGYTSVEDRELLRNPLASFIAAATSPTRKLVLAVYGGELRVYETSTGRCMRTIEHSSGKNASPAWPPTGRLFACTGKDHDVHVWKADTGELVASFAGHSESITGVVFTRDEQHVLSALWDGTIHRGTIGQNGQQSSSEILFQSDGDPILTFAVSSDEKWILSASYRRKSPPDTSSADLLAPPSRQPVKDYDGDYNTLRLHNANTGRVVWIEHHPCISSVAFSEDCTRALAGNYDGEVFLYDLTQVIPPDPSVPRSPPPLAVPEHKLGVRQTQFIRGLSFSPNGKAVITDRAYTSIPSELQPLHTDPTDRSLTAIFFYEDDWLWHVNLDSDPRRLCWIPPLFRPHAENRTESLSSASGQSIAYISVQGSLVVMDRVSVC